MNLIVRAEQPERDRIDVRAVTERNVQHTCSQLSFVAGVACELTHQVPGWRRARHDTVDQVRKILIELIEPTRAEEGCITYELLQNDADPADFTFVEALDQPRGVGSISADQPRAGGPERGRRSAGGRA